MENVLPPRARCIRRYTVVSVAIAAGAYCGFKFGENLGFTVVGGLIGFLLVWRFAQFRYGDPIYAQRYPSARLSVMLSGGAWVLKLLVAFKLFLPQFLKGDDVGRIGLFLMFPLTTFLWAFAGPLASSAASHALVQVAKGTKPPSDEALARLGLKLSRMFTGMLLLYLIWIGSMMGGCG